MLDWCDSVNAVVIPWGGGSSVVGGVEPPRTDRPVVTIDLKHLDRVLEIDTTSQAARIQGGTYGPALESQLKPSGLTLRHFPQSFEFSTLGGWIATRSGGHYATLYTHIDDFVESLRVVTPAGSLESFRLPGSGAGPSPDRHVHRLRGHPRHHHRSLDAAASAADVSRRDHRALQGFLPGGRSACAPSPRRICIRPTAGCSMPDEALVNGAGDGTHSILVLTFESADRPQEANLQRALEIVRAHRRRIRRKCGSRPRARNARAQPDNGATASCACRTIREVLTPRGIIAETFETAITWDRFPRFPCQGQSRNRAGDRGSHGTHRPGHLPLYPRLPGRSRAVFLASMPLGDKRRLVEQCWAIKIAASEVLNELGGTITHHHAVGRDHRRWYDQQRPDLFAGALLAAKKSLDPRGMLNPGVLVDPLA